METVLREKKNLIKETKLEKNKITQMKTKWCWVPEIRVGFLVKFISLAASNFVSSGCVRWLLIKKVNCRYYSERLQGTQQPPPYTTLIFLICGWCLSQAFVIIFNFSASNFKTSYTSSILIESIYFFHQDFYFIFSVNCCDIHFDLK